MRVLRPGEGTDNEWRFVQPESGAVFNGFSYWQVKDTVEAHRRAMGYDLSEGWEERFQHDLCKQNEEVLCTDRPAKPRGQRRLTLQDLKRFMLTASKWRGGETRGYLLSLSQECDCGWVLRMQRHLGYGNEVSWQA